MITFPWISIIFFFEYFRYCLPHFINFQLFVCTYFEINNATIICIYSYVCKILMFLLLAIKSAVVLSGSWWQQRKQKYPKHFSLSSIFARKFKDTPENTDRQYFPMKQKQLSQETIKTFQKIKISFKGLLAICLIWENIGDLITLFMSQIGIPQKITRLCLTRKPLQILFFFFFSFVSTEVCPESPHTEGSLRGLEVSKYMPPEEVPDLCGLAVKVVFRIWVIGLDLVDQLTIRPQYKVKFKEALIKYQPS